MQTRFATETARWQAVATRDAQAAGTFLYAVRSTGIYCRPGCAARLPRRDNVVFFAAASDAERAGFRACKRCRPDAVSAQAQLVRRACAYLDARPDQPVTLAQLAAQLELSPFHVQRSFKRALGISPLEYQRARRLERFKSGLRAGASVTAALYDAGFGSSSRLYASASRELGMKPSAYGRKGEDQHIRYTLLDSALGSVLLAATPRGLCKVALGDDREQLEADLRAEFAAAVIERNAAELSAYAAAIGDYLRGADAGLELPLDIAATAFQQRVYRALRAIPRGQTRNYGQIAAGLGMPLAARAVGSACARNPVALVVPCHRVLPAGGGLGGFAWGLPRKRALLELEQRVLRVEKRRPRG